MNFDWVVPLMQFIAGIAVLILLHEFGHFIAARALNVEVEEFGIGFPPRLVKLFEFKGTEYTINWIPLGGFVRPKGENDPEVPGGLASASPWVRLVVFVAGPAMNLIVGVILATILFYQWGEPVTSQVLVRLVAPGSPAETAGLLPDDQFVSVNGQPIDSAEKLQNLVAENLGKEITIVVLRSGEEVTVSLAPRADPPEGEGAMGVGLDFPTRPIGMGLAIQRGAQTVYEQMRGITMLPVHLVSGNASPEESRLVGYKGMFDIYQYIQNPLYFFMMISVSLGMINLFPIPALDGGRILLTLPEIIVRRRIPAQYETMIHMIGFTLLLLLLIYINLQDFLNPLALPTP